MVAHSGRGGEATGNCENCSKCFIPPSRIAIDDEGTQSQGMKGCEGNW